MSFCGAATNLFRSFQKGGQRVESLNRPAAPGLEPGVVRRAMKWKPVPKLKPGRRPTSAAAHAAAADFCRQARRVRATLGHDPVRMHQQLKQLTVVTRLDDTPQPDPLRATRFGRAEVIPDPVLTGWEDPDDGFPRYTLLDPNDAPVDDEDDYDYLPPDRAFRRTVETAFIDQGSALLRYSQRLELLEQAGELGLQRFEANLIIASVENAARESETPAGEPKPSRLSAWMVFLATQSFLTAGFWRLVRG